CGCPIRRRTRVVRIDTVARKKALPAQGSWPRGELRRIDMSGLAGRRSPGHRMLVGPRRMIVFALLLAAGSAGAAGWQRGISGGAQIDSSPHGVFDVGVRKGSFSIQLYTDTLEVRYEPRTDKGRFFIAARGEALAAGLFISPWTNGAPDGTRALTASCGGL